VLFLLALAMPGCGSIREGHKWVKDVELVGAEELDAADVLAGLETHELPWYWYWLWWIPAVERAWYDPDVLLSDLDRIETYYAANGFFEAKVTKHKTTIPKGDDTASVVITVKEGPATKVTGLKITGLEQLDAALVVKATDKLGVEVGERFNYGAYLLTKERLATRLKENGYAYAAVEGVVEVHRPKRSAVIKLTATPGPLVRFGPTTFEGLGDIPEEKVRLLIQWEEGEIYDQEKVRKTRSAMFKQRVFSAVHVKLPVKPTAMAPITIRTQPTTLREIRLGLGLGLEMKRHELHLSSRWTWRNFLGGLRVLEMEFIPSFIRLPTFWDMERQGPGIDAEVKLTQPYIFNSYISAFAAIGYELEQEDGYSLHGLKASAGLDRPFWRERIWAGVSWNFQLKDFYDTVLDFGDLDPYRPAWLEQYLELDLRDDVSSPRAGFWATVRVEEGFEYVASEYTYVKVTPEVRGYIPLGTKRLILALRGKFGYLHPLDSPDAETNGFAAGPITRRYTLGGPNCHRGFSYGRLSPYATSTSTGQVVPVGGHVALLLSADLRLRIYRLFGYWLSVNAFFDAGDVTDEISEMDFKEDSPHMAVGGGVTFETPIGALRSSVGFRTNRLEEFNNRGGANPDPGDWWALHITLGEAF